MDIRMNKLFILLCVFLAGSVSAETTLADVSQVLLSGSGILTKVMWAACIIVGILLIAAAFTQFQIHRRNPKLVPLTTPVLYLILGIGAIAIPFIERVTGFLEKENQAKGVQTLRGNRSNINDIDAPIN